MPDALLSVEGLAVAFRHHGGWRDVVRSASFQVRPGEALGLVGESGSGKTVTALSILGLVSHMGGRISHGRVVFAGRDLAGLTENEWRELRGRRIGMIFQHPTRALDPAFTVGDQIAEAVRLHLGWSRRAARARAVEMLDRVHIARAEQRVRDYPHMLSGGMCQRVMIAIALACGPDLLVADEPTTALDVTVQLAILDLIDELRRDGLTTVLVSHDLGVVARVCDRVAVMYAGDVVEGGATEDVLRRPRHPYTEGLLRSLARADATGRFRGISGQVPAMDEMPDGCRFGSRCEHHAAGVCDSAQPLLTDGDEGRAVACARSGELVLGRSRR